MQVRMKTRVLSKETRTSRKTGMEYTLMNFMDGDQVVNAMMDQNCRVEIIPFNEYELTIDVNLRFGSARIVWVSEVK